MAVNEIYELDGGTFIGQFEDPGGTVPYTNSAHALSTAIGPGIMSDHSTLFIRNSTSSGGQGAWYGYGSFNIHASLDRAFGEDNEALYLDDIVGWTEEQNEADRYVGLVGFFYPIDKNDPDNIPGVGFYFDFTNDRVCTYVADSVWGRTTQVRRKFDIGETAGFGTKAHQVGVHIRGDRKAVEFWYNGELVDFYIMPEGEFFGRTGGPPYAFFYGYSEPAGGLLTRVRTHFKGLANPYQLRFGEYTTAGVELISSAGQPTKPTITVDQIQQTRARGNSSAFVGAPDESQTHAASAWQVTLAADTDFSTPVIDTGAVSGSRLLQELFQGLTPATDYIARVRHLGDGTAGVAWSEWSDAAAFTTLDGVDEVGGGGNIFDGGTGIDCEGDDAFGPTVWSQD